MGAADQADGRLEPDDAVDRRTGRSSSRRSRCRSRPAPCRRRPPSRCPLDDPQGLRLSAWGLRVWPPTALQPEIELLERMFAHSLRLALPTITAPAARSRATRGASRPVTLSTRARLPAVVGSGPMVSILSLIRIGMPNSGPRARRIAVERPRLVERGRIDRDDRVEPRIEPADPRPARRWYWPAALASELKRGLALPGRIAQADDGTKRRQAGRRSSGQRAASRFVVAALSQSDAGQCPSR